MSNKIEKKSIDVKLMFDTLHETCELLTCLWMEKWPVGSPEGE